jgi:hypothetical protein
MSNNMITIQGFKRMIKEYVQEAKEMDLFKIEENKIHLDSWEASDLLFYSEDMETGVTYELYLKDKYTGTVQAETDLYFNDKEMKIVRDVTLTPVAPLKRILVNVELN